MCHKDEYEQEIGNRLIWCEIALKFGHKKSKKPLDLANTNGLFGHNPIIWI